MAKKNKHAEFVCFWCEKKIPKQQKTRDHLYPLGMGGDAKKVVPACSSCNHERGKVTELYNARNHMIKWIENNPVRITSYKNRFRKKVRKLADKIVKWELLHRQKGIILPFCLLEIVKLDEIMPLEL